MARIAENVFLLATVIASMVGWLIAFIGACVFRRALTGGAWWIIIYELLLIIGFSTVLLTNNYAHYRLVILAFLAASIALLTGQLDYVFPVARFNTSLRGGAGAYGAGYIILIIVEFLWILVLGSEPDSYLGKFGPAFYGNTVGIGGTQHRQQPIAQAPYEMTGDKTILTDSAAPYGTATSTHSYNNYDNSHIAPTNIVTSPAHPAAATVEPHMPTPAMAQTTNNVEYREKVQALHAYQANPDDPNELSFTKGETLDIVDRNGNWWQARKADGTMGIIPSNYFAPSP